MVVTTMITDSMMQLYSKTEHELMNNGFGNVRLYTFAEVVQCYPVYIDFITRQFKVEEDLFNELTMYPVTEKLEEVIVAFEYSNEYGNKLVKLFMEIIMAIVNQHSLVVATNFGNEAAIDFILHIKKLIHRPQFNLIINTISGGDHETALKGRVLN